MKFIAQIKVMPLKNILDPQGKAVQAGLKNIGHHNVSQVRVGKNIEVILEADNQEAAQRQVEEMSKSFLANLIVEDFEVVVQPLES
ncbi:MAG: phosphoribosylformylglycinamidine synthase subunit PurS [Bacteroidia bacterium]|nr:phosphoribosylformylglycinamidine synthase subunit PurS [Bacteroidia bacterium]MDW8301253.1 phosphoribosylformylglycinamidine synthase subunit PurS [Bacteroidia bacterium]